MVNLESSEKWYQNFSELDFAKVFRIWPATAPFPFLATPPWGSRKRKRQPEMRFKTRSVGPAPSNIINLTIRTHRAVTTNIKQNIS